MAAAGVTYGKTTNDDACCAEKSKFILIDMEPIEFLLALEVMLYMPPAPWVNDLR